MAIYKGDKKVIALYKGDKPILKRYKGTELIYELKTKNETLSFAWSGTSTSQRFSINGTYYTASTNPYTTTLTDLGIEDFTSATYMFNDRSAITAITSIPDTSEVTTMSNMFAGCSGLTTLDVITTFDTSNVNDMNYMFSNSKKLTSLDVSNFNTSKVKYMNYMFRGCSGLTSLNLSNFDTSKVTWMHNMFDGCSSLTSLNLSNFDTSKVTWMHNMFDGCSSLTSLDLSNFDTSKVTRMENMFYGCKSLTSLDVSNWNTSAVTNMYYMFTGCSGLTSLNLSNWNFSNVTDMTYMFANCSTLSSLNLDGCVINTGTTNSYTSMFQNCPLTSISMYGCDCDTIKFIADRLIDATIISSYNEAYYIIQTDNIDCLEDDTTIASPAILEDCNTPINVLYVNPEIYSQYATKFSGGEGARFDTISCGQGEFIYIPRTAKMGDSIEIYGTSYVMDGIELIDGTEYNVFNFKNILGDPLYLAESTDTDLNRYGIYGLFYYQ